MTCTRMLLRRALAIPFRRSSSSSLLSKSSKLSLFLSPPVQSSLRELTGLDYSRVFRIRKTGQALQPPTYAFLTEAQLIDRAESTRRRALSKLQMPPVMDERVEVTHTLEEDRALVGLDQCRYMFTDISFGVHDRDRVIVVREPDGTLRKAKWEERDRANQIYFPKEGRKIDMPAMFQVDKLQEILRADRYEYILDRLCVQFEPDHPVFVRVAKTVFEHIDHMGQYDVLQSTRHYGPMVFHLVWERICDDLMVHLLLNKRSVDLASCLVNVFAHVHSDSSVASMISKPEINADTLLKVYIDKDSSKANKIRLTLENLRESLREEEKLRTSHGISDKQPTLADTLKLE